MMLTLACRIVHLHAMQETCTPQGILNSSRSVPVQMNLWDDHDIWDGWGSYPEHLQNCPVFQGRLDQSMICFCLNN